MGPNRLKGSEKYLLNGSVEKIDFTSFAWSKDDTVAVFSAHSDFYDYRLVKGDGTTSATFGTSTAIDFDDEDTYFALYPSYMASDDKLLWPDAQTVQSADSYLVPMCATGDISGTNLADGTFCCLGGELNVSVSLPKTALGVNIAKITLETHEFISGPFEIQGDESGDCMVARISSEKGLNSITLTFSETMEMEPGNTYKCHFAVPESPDGGYTQLSFSFYDEDNNLLSVVTSSDSPVIGRGKTGDASVTLDVQPTAPGVYSVSEDNKVRFAAGNLYVDASKKPYAYGFEYLHPRGTDDRTKEHMCAFYWSSDITVSCAETYSDDKRNVDDVLFVNKENPTLYGMQWRALTMDEWEYLLYTRPMKNDHVRFVCHDNGMQIYSDDFDNDTNTDKVVIPYTRLYMNVKMGFYWTADSFCPTKGAPLQDEEQARLLVFRIRPEAPGASASPYSSFLRSNTANIRLVTDVK